MKLDKSTTVRIFSIIVLGICNQQYARRWDALKNKKRHSKLAMTFLIKRLMCALSELINSVERIIADWTIFIERHNAGD